MDKEKKLSIQDQIFNLQDCLNLLKHEKTMLVERMEKLEENLNICAKELEKIKQSYIHGTSQ